MTTAYRGYLINVHPYNHMLWITKDGHHICTAYSVQHAKSEIDALLD